MKKVLVAALAALVCLAGGVAVAGDYNGAAPAAVQKRVVVQTVQVQSAPVCNKNCPAPAPAPSVGDAVDPVPVIPQAVQGPVYQKRVIVQEVIPVVQKQVVVQQVAPVVQQRVLVQNVQTYAQPANVAAVRVQSVNTHSNAANVQVQSAGNAGRTNIKVNTNSNSGGGLFSRLRGNSGGNTNIRVNSR